MKMDLLRYIGAQSVDFPILGADPSGPFVLKGVDGLGPTQVNVRMGKTVLRKALYQGKSPVLRQIIAVVGLQPNWDEGQTAEELRTILYGLLTPRYNEMVRVEIRAEGATKAFAQGQVSKMEPAMFTKDPAVQIVVDCDDAYLLHPSEVVVQPAQVAATGVRQFTIDNEGTADSGFKAGFTLMANVGTTLTLADADPRGQRMQIDGINWLAGDRFVIDTREGSRGVWRGPGGGALVSVLNNMNAGVSEWMQLYGGENLLQINTTAFDWDPEFSFSYQPAYWGV
jgi:hypothetical protein